jgi:hypothetical protein
MHSKNRLVLFWLEEKEDWDEDTIEYFIHLRFSGPKKPLLIIQLRNYLKSVTHTRKRIYNRKKKSIASFEDTEFKRIFGSTTHIVLDEVRDELMQKDYFCKLKVAKKPDMKHVQRLQKKARSNEIKYRKHLKRQTRKHFNQLMHRAIFHDYAFVKPLSNEERRWLQNKLIEKSWVEECRRDISRINIL